MGEIKQKPPAFSAIKVNGVRAYDLARQGKEVELPQRKVTIYEIDILSFSNPYIIIKVVCSKGTYIRSICNDIGEKLGCGAYMNFLIRTSTGSYSLDNSHLLDEINKENIGQLITPPEYALNFSSIYIDEEFKDRVLNGNSIKIKNPSAYPNSELLKIFLKPDIFIALGRVENNLLKIEKLLI
jgi:tRNA pseudouridine55 synthase